MAAQAVGGNAPCAAGLDEARQRQRDAGVAGDGVQHHEARRRRHTRHQRRLDDVLCTPAPQCESHTCMPSICMVTCVARAAGAPGGCCREPSRTQEADAATSMWRPVGDARDAVGVCREVRSRGIRGALPGGGGGRLRPAMGGQATAKAHGRRDDGQWPMHAGADIEGYGEGGMLQLQHPQSGPALSIWRASSSWPAPRACAPLRRHKTAPRCQLTAFWCFMEAVKGQRQAVDNKSQVETMRH